jgi:dipeptidyl aminopeptidase/acylaminoacyl peptidase
MIISEEEILLPEDQQKMVRSGWGDAAMDDVTVKKIVYNSDGIEVEGYLAYPKNTDKIYPLVIWNRGGIKKDGLIDPFLAQGMFGEIASWNYVVLASQYRKDDEYGGEDVNDVLNLFPVADELDFCDSKIVGMEGWSRGGMMAYRVLSMTDRIKCSVIISGLANLFRNEEQRKDQTQVYKKLFGSENENEFYRRKMERSAVYFADKISKSVHILLIHGTDDKIISNEDSQDMYELLKKNNIDADLILIDGGDHYLRKHRRELAETRKNWFDKFLKQRSSI